MPTLNWTGKEKVVMHHLDVPIHALEFSYGFSAENGQENKPTDSGNIIIHGDNLIALKALMTKYEGRVDCIYIDPPYNTGKKLWVYNDNVDDPHIMKWIGEVVGKQGEDLQRHDKWLCMMYPRLQLLRQLLSAKGVIFISIDDNEVAPLRLICDEIFGQDCFVADIIWQKTYSPRNDSKGIPTEIDHTIVYSKRPDWQPQRLERTEEMNAIYKNPDNDICLWRNSDAFAPGAATHQGMVYAVQHPFTGELIYPTKGRHWAIEQDSVKEILQEWASYELEDINDSVKRAELCDISVKDIRKGVMAIMLTEPLNISRAKAQAVYERGQWPKFFFTNGGKGGIARKTYLSAVEGKLATNLWHHSYAGHTDEAKKELKAIFNGSIPFDTPKPTRLVERILQIATDENSLVLDSFAGSGTTGQAVLNLNKRDNGKRHFILVELMDYAETVTAERVKRVITGYSWKGKKEETIFSQQLTVKRLMDFPKLMDLALSVSEAAKSQYDNISKPKIEDNCLKVIGTKIYKDKTEPLGGAFDYFELGKPLFNSDGTINSDVETEKLRTYIWQSETRLPTEPNNEYFLGCHYGIAYYFFYEPGESMVFGPELLPLIKEKAEAYIIYAEGNTMADEWLLKYHITFKRIPGDIRKF